MLIWIAHFGSLKNIDLSNKPISSIGQLRIILSDRGGAGLVKLEIYEFCPVKRMLRT
jgi:hypothetical protein